MFHFLSTPSLGLAPGDVEDVLSAWKGLNVSASVVLQRNICYRTFRFMQVRAAVI